ncbi:hypothetical protein, partial [Loktanella sp. S4079]|uniref:hypothetical protein n=1 Tax=Loktanella sp. S4079 TaxID=579483 RepID=UPI0005FA619D
PRCPSPTRPPYGGTAGIAYSTAYAPIRGGEVDFTIWYPATPGGKAITVGGNPRIACYQSLGTLDGVCGYGGALGIESADNTAALTYAFEIDGERGDDYSMSSASLSIERAIGKVVLSGTAGMTSRGNATVGGNFEINF